MLKLKSLNEFKSFIKKNATTSAGQDIIKLFLKEIKYFDCLQLQHVDLNDEDEYLFSLQQKKL